MNDVGVRFPRLHRWVSAEMLTKVCLLGSDDIVFDLFLLVML